VIPCEAVAKISMRLVPGQSPRGAFTAVRTHLDDRCPKGMKASFEDVNPGTPAFRLPLASPVFRLAANVLEEMDARGPVFQWDGASIPVVSALRETSGAAPLLVGWGQPQDRIHSPNESYGLNQFARAMEWGEKILAAL
jgi:acetylornithine deacetylase/succinyl-diaminopimelate desuccinylase-like protein